MRLGDAIDRNLIDNTASNRTVLAREIGELFFDRFEVSRDRPELVRHVEIVVEIVDTLTAKGFEIDPDGDPFFLAECTRIAVDYLEAFLQRTESFVQP